MPVIEIKDLTIPELMPYVASNEIQLKRYFEPDLGIFIAESPKVIRLALEADYEPISLLIERKYISGQASDIVEKCGNIPIYTADSSLLTQLTGFRLTQGVLCAMRRKELPSADEICRNATRIAVLEDVMNQTNIGAIIRSAVALDFDAVLLTSASSDPLYRRSVRVSMGNVFKIPWSYINGDSPDYVDYLRNMGFTTVAMALHSNTVDIDNPVLKNQPKIAVILGTEGDGLKESTIESCDFTAKIPMANGVDSLNVAAASAVTFWELRKK
ncbi:MAG: RNA methyltransferase [Ruminococcus flavefaciens]|nr:RNA methyltransferase [Ruminococcus flavefaciens]MCM1230504.1 RNA methyltransferase [Ruminococcus flavefaciens]